MDEEVAFIIGAPMTNGSQRVPEGGEVNGAAVEMPDAEKAAHEDPLPCLQAGASGGAPPAGAAPKASVYEPRNREEVVGRSTMTEFAGP